MGDDLLELAKAKELASIMGGAWHTEEVDDSDSDSEQTGNRKAPLPPRPGGHANGTSNGNSSSNKSSKEGGGSFLSKTLSGYNWMGGGGNAGSGSNSSIHSSTNGDSSKATKDKDGSGRGNGGGGAVAALGVRGRRSAGGGRRPANGRAPGRRDPAAVARLEAEAAARLKAERAQPAGVDRTWQLPVNVDYYTAPAALLRELVKEMPADKRLSFQTRVANAHTKEAIESVLQDYAARLERLVLPHARSREMDLQQVKKDMARERVVLDGEEIAFWENASDKPHTWHEELWATVESRVTEGLLSGDGSPPAAAASATSTDGDVPDEERVAPAVGHNARALAHEEWNKARSVATTSEVFKAMSRTGAGGDAYFSLVALFCTADKLVVPVHCQESPITVEFLSRSSGGAGKSKSPRRNSKGWGSGSSSKKESTGGGGEVHILVTVPSTFDIYLRDGAAPSESGGSGGGRPLRGNDGGGGGGGCDGGKKIQRKRSASSNLSNGGGDGAAAADASIALHLVRVRAVVEERIRVVGSSSSSSSSSSSKMPAASASSSSFSDGSTPFLLDPAARDERRTSLGTDGQRVSNGQHLGSRGLPEGPAAAAAAAGVGVGVGRDGGAGGGDGEPSTSVLAPLALTRTERRMCVAVVPEPSAVSEMVRNFSRKIGVDVPSPQPPRVLGR
ncbi:unnamed protein product [Pylaiella littoralis]